MKRHRSWHERGGSLWSDLSSDGEIVPLVNGTPLVELVGWFERQRGSHPAGGYVGLIPEQFDFGDLGRYYLGVDNHRWPRPGTVWLLGCVT